MSGWPYPRPADCGGARHLVPGRAAPRLSLPGTTGADVDFAARRGWSVVYVYPWTGGPGLANPPNWDAIPGAHGSTPETEGFRDLHPAFRDLGVAVFGLSGQGLDHQRELAARLGLPFAILSDARFQFADALSLPRFETGGAAYLERLTLVIRDGAIARLFYPVHPPDRHAAEVLAWLKAALLVLRH